MDGAHWNFVILWVLILLMACGLCTIYVWFCIHQCNQHSSRRSTQPASPTQPPTLQNHQHPSQPTVPPIPTDFQPTRQQKTQKTSHPPAPPSTPRPRPQPMNYSGEYTPYLYPMKPPLPPRPDGPKPISPYAISCPPYAYMNFPPQAPTWSDIKSYRQKGHRPVPFMGTRSMPSTSFENLPEAYV